MAATMPEHRALVDILGSLMRRDSADRDERTLSQRIAFHLQDPFGAHEAQRPMLAQLLLALLEQFPDESSETALFQYVYSVISNAEGTGMEFIAGDRDVFAAKIVLARTDLVRKFAVRFSDAMATLISSASHSHASSDDASEVDFTPFLKNNSTFKPWEAIPKRDGEANHSGELGHIHQEVAIFLRFSRALLSMDGDCESLQSPECRDLVPFLFTLVGLRNREIAEASCQVVGLLLGAVDSGLPEGASEMIWDAVQILLGSPKSADLAFTVWLRWVSLSNCYSRPSRAILQQETYWSHLQNGLSTGFSERRKFCLYILNTSLQLISEPLENRFMTYDASSKSHGAAWAKYSTLIEISSLSTSTNQLLAAFPDMRRLLGMFSPIHGSWIVVLMKLGLGASNGPLQRVVWDFLLSLEGEELGKLIEGPEGMGFVTEVFLPYAIAAHHFSVQKTGKYGDTERCEHGEQLCEAVSRLVQQRGEGTLEELLAFLDNRADNIFPPARVYVLQGLLRGASGLTGIGRSGLESIVRIAKMGRFAKMKTELCVTMCLQFLQLVDLERVAHEQLVDALVEIVAGNEHLLSGRYLADLMGDSSVISHNLERVKSACDVGPSPSDKMLLKVALLVISQVYMDREHPTGYESHSAREAVNGVRFLSVLFSNRVIAGELLHTERVREVVTRDLVRSTRGFRAGNECIGELADLAGKIHLPDSIGSEEAEETSLAAWERQNNVSAENGPTFVEKSRRRADLLAICQRCVGAGPAPLWAPEALHIISSFEVPGFGQNNHENRDITQAAGGFLYSAYGLLSLLVCKSPRQECSRAFVARLFSATTRLFRFIKGKVFVRVLECFAFVFEAAPDAVSSYPELASLLSRLWENADSMGLGAGTAATYTALLEAIFHATIVKSSVTDGGVASVLTTVSRDIIKLCTGKRSLAPAFAKALRSAFLASPDSFCECEWAVEVFREFIDLPTNRDPEFMVETCLARVFDEVCLVGEKNHYESYHREKEIYSQVYVFDVLAKLDVASPIQCRFAVGLKSRVFKPWALNKPGMPVYSKWKKATQLQCLVALERFVVGETSGGFLDTLVNTLCNEPHPRYRFMFEWVISLCIIRFPEHRNNLWNHLQFPENPNSRLQASLLRVCTMVARELGEDMKEGFCAELLYTVIPLTGNSKVAVRHQAISTVLELWDNLPEKSLLRENVIFQRVRQSILNSPYYKEASSSGKLVGEWTFNAKSNYTLTGIFAGRYLLGTDEADIIPPNLFPTSPSYIPFGSPGPAGYELEFTKTEKELLPPAPVAPLQTKSGVWDAKILLEPGKTRQYRPEIVVVASLVENNYNLGGLSRVSEIMGVSQLCIHSKDTLKSCEFTSVSVHSESWLPISQLPASDIGSFIREKKATGFEVVGIEQTDNSLILGGPDGKKFGNKTVIILGSEKYGIPAKLLAELDVCVEIEQVGQTRSMNVQTAAAVVLYEIRKQFG